MSKFWPTELYHIAHRAPKGSVILGMGWAGAGAGPTIEFHCTQPHWDLRQWWRMRNSCVNPVVPWYHLPCYHNWQIQPRGPRQFDIADADDFRRLSLFRLNAYADFISTISSLQSSWLLTKFLNYTKTLLSSLKIKSMSSLMSECLTHWYSNQINQFLLQLFTKSSFYWTYKIEIDNFFKHFEFQ